MWMVNLGIIQFDDFGKHTHSQHAHNYSMIYTFSHADSTPNHLSECGFQPVFSMSVNDNFNYTLTKNRNLPTNLYISISSDHASGSFGFAT